MSMIFIMCWIRTEQRENTHRNSKYYPPKQHSQMGPSWAQLGPNWGPTWPNLGPAGAHIKWSLSWDPLVILKEAPWQTSYIYWLVFPAPLVISPLLSVERPFIRPHYQKVRHVCLVRRPTCFFCQPFPSVKLIVSSQRLIVLVNLWSSVEYWLFVTGYHINM